MGPAQHTRTCREGCCGAVAASCEMVASSELEGRPANGAVCPTQDPPCSAGWRSQLKGDPQWRECSGNLQWGTST